MCPFMSACLLLHVRMCVYVCVCIVLCLCLPPFPPPFLPYQFQLSVSGWHTLLLSSDKAASCGVAMALALHPLPSAIGL